MCHNCEDVARQSCAMVRRWRFFGNSLHHAFLDSSMQHVSDLHPKFVLGPHHVWKFTILWGHVEEISLFNKFYFRLSIRAIVAKM